MPPKIQGRPVTIYLTDEQLERLEKIAQIHQIPRAEATRRMLDLGTDVYETYSGVGIPQLAELMKRARNACRNEMPPRIA